MSKKRPYKDTEIFDRIEVWYAVQGVMDGFNWGTTPEGEVYWDEVKNKLRAIQQEIIAREKEGTW